MQQKVILLGLNELNFDFVHRYIQQGLLPNFSTLFEKYGYCKTTSEAEYSLLEPWIQWVSIHTGKTFAEHKVFRLGDIVQRQDLVQLWEVAESRGLTVGAISPFNARNNIQKGFFVPDPWTQTTASGADVLKQMAVAVSNAVNENANGKVNKAAAIALLKGVLKYVPVRRWSHYAGLAMKIKRKYAKPAILDNVLADTFITLWKQERPDFSSLFLNAGAHLQHHYMFNAKVYDGEQKNPDWYLPAHEDPLLDILKEYDSILGRLVHLDCRLFLATGLHQKPHLHNTFYWRLKNHEFFLQTIGITAFKQVVPRMSRDFLIECNSEAEAMQVQAVLEGLALKDGIKVFTVDNRGESLFVELTYYNNIAEGSFITIDGASSKVDLFDYVSFVAIKNGEHDGIGYLLDTDKKYSGNDTMPVTQVFTEICNSFS